VVPASDKSLEEIINEVESDESQVRESADSKVPDDVLLSVIKKVGVIPHAGDCVYVERAIYLVASLIV
jgi:hypothetical protein